MKHFAHVKWFIDENIPTVDPLSMTEWAVILTLVAAGTAALYVVHRILSVTGVYRFFEERLGKYAGYIPTIVRISTGALLLINAATGILFAPNVPTSITPLGIVMSVALAAAGALLILGYQVRLAALVILGVYGASLLLIRPVIDVLDHVEYIGIGLYLLLHGNVQYRKRVEEKNLTNWASPESLLRIFIGLGLMILALSEKLIGISNSAYFLSMHHWNFLQSFGLTDRNFIIGAGTAELLIGLTLILNIAPRLTTLGVLFIMTLTAIMLGIEEVIGHLYVLSLLAIVWLAPGKHQTEAKDGTQN